MKLAFTPEYAQPGTRENPRLVPGVNREESGLDFRPYIHMPYASIAPGIQYLTGEKTGVVMTFSDHERFLEDLQDLAAIVDRRSEPTIPHEE